MPKTELNSFVLRQTAQSRFSHYEPASGIPAHTFAELDALIARQFEQATWTTADSVDVSNGPKLFNSRDDGKVIKLALASADCKGFFSGVVRADDTTVFKTVCAVRDRALTGERPFIHSVAVNGKKAPAVFVEVVLYHVSALSVEERTYTPEGTNDAVIQVGEWQVVSVNARDTFEPEPPTPQAMARNMAAHLGLAEGAGGTPRVYTAEEFVQSILYWSDRAMSG
ncbi:MAG: DUF3228 family protein [Candidatus Melainabacteria bacterium]|nr:DUF3228 family protein [Candidatus Melainabacteria bacterium]